MTDLTNMSKTVGPIENLDDYPVIAENIRLRNALEKAEAERDAAITRAETAEAFIADFAAFNFTEAPRPHIRDPQDEPDEYVDAQEVWEWQSDARDLLK